MRVTVTSNAFGTWLEPYIGWAFEFVRYKNRQVYFLMDTGNGIKEEKSHDFDAFKG
jgi:hypothetical protein